MEGGSCNSFSPCLVYSVSVWFADSTCIIKNLRQLYMFAFQNWYFTFLIETEVLIKSIVYVRFTLSQMNLTLVLLEAHILCDAFISLSGIMKGLKNYLCKPLS